MNAVWAIDFMRDTLYSRRVFRTLNVLDEANRGALGIDVGVSIPAARVIVFLEQMIICITGGWLERYNEIRPHDALVSLPPTRYREQLLATTTPV